MPNRIAAFAISTFVGVCVGVFPILGDLFRSGDQSGRIEFDLFGPFLLFFLATVVSLPFSLVVLVLGLMLLRSFKTEASLHFFLAGAGISGFIPAAAAVFSGFAGPHADGAWLRIFSLFALAGGLAALMYRRLAYRDTPGPTTVDETIETPEVAR